MAYESFDNINQHELQAVIEAEINLFENTRSTNTYTNMEAPTFQEQFQPNYLQQQQQQFQPRQLMPEPRTRLKVRKSQRVQTLRKYLAVESLIHAMPMAT